MKKTVLSLTLFVSFIFADNFTLKSNTLKGQLTHQQRQEIEDKIAQETQAMTPPEVKKYMKRVHQDPAEVQGPAGHY